MQLSGLCWAGLTKSKGTAQTKARHCCADSHCQPGMSPQNSAQVPACSGLPGSSTQVIHLKSPISCSQCYPCYESVVIFATYLEHFFCCRTTRNRQMQTDDTICLGECSSSTQLLIPAGSNTAWESTREVRGTTSSHHFCSRAREKCFKLRFPKEWLGSRNKIRFPIKFANVAMNVSSSVCPELLRSHEQKSHSSPA